MPDPPRILAALGYEVTAFITLEIRQAGGHDPVAERLAAIPTARSAPRRPGPFASLVGRCRARSAAVPRATESPSRKSEVSLTREDAWLT